MGKNKKRYYSKEFKREAVEFSLNSNKTIKTVAEDLGASPYNLFQVETRI